MTMMMKMKTTVAAGALTILGTFPLSGQTGLPPAQECEDGLIAGNLGISGLDCVGECTVTLSREGKEESWVFSTEPRVFSVEGGGPAEGILEPGDYLVAIDGVLITTRQGGRKYADVEPGEIVTLRYRRDGNVHEAGIRVGSHCRPAPVSTVVYGRVAPPPRLDHAVPLAGIVSVPRVRVVEVREAYASALAVPTTERGLLGSMDPTPRGRLGIGLGCTECGTRTDDDTGEDIWFFSGPIEVTQVNSGGPAEDAGIQMGDLIISIEGHDITTDARGLAFSALTPGEAVRMTVIKRNGREVGLTVVPSEPSAGYLRGRLIPPPAPDATEPLRSMGIPVLRPAQPGVPDRGDWPEPTPGMTGPEGLPMTYSGTVAGVEVVVRGGPVAVSELRGTRTIIINSDGLWIRIRVPAGSTGIGVGGTEVR